jgi:hypothetical protein
MEENKVEKTLISTERRFLGIRILTATQGKNAGNKFGMLDLYELKKYDDGSATYNLSNAFLSLEKAKEIMANGFAPWQKVKVEFEEIDSLYAKPKIKALIPIN